MSATDELRKLLDERGVEWMDDSYAQLWCTVWNGLDGKQWRMTENQSGMLTELKAWQATPEQAIAATLGSGECEFVIEDNMNETEGMGDIWIECSACHCTFDYYADEWLMNMHYCPNCGRKVVDK